jgi:hypothetical protein
MDTAMNRIIYFLIAGLLACISQSSAAHGLATCNSPITYEDHNQIDPKPLKLDRISGIAKDDQGVSIANVCIGLFSEKDHRLIASAETREDGRYTLGEIPPGRYRLVAKHPALCVANVPLLVGSQTHRSKKELVLHMKVGGVDSCSYGDLNPGNPGDRRDFF